MKVKLVYNEEWIFNKFVFEYSCPLTIFSIIKY